MRELGVRNSLRTEGAAWARAPGQRHRDQNVTSDISYLSNAGHSPDPKSGAIVTGYQRRSSCPCTCSSQRHTRAVGARSGRYEGMVPPPPLPQQKKKKSPLVQPPPPRANAIATGPWRHPQAKAINTSSGRDPISAAAELALSFPLFPRALPCRMTRRTLPWQESPWASAPVWEKKVPRAGVHPTLVQSKCDAI